MIKLEGTIEKINFYNESNGYAVIKVLVDESIENNLLIENTFTATGVMYGVSIGETIVVEGDWTFHNKYGMQFKVENYNIKTPASLNSIERYLSSGLIRGIGLVMAKNIVDRFGEDTLNVIEKEPEKLLQIPKIGQKKLETIIESYKEQKEIKDVIMKLQEYGISPNYALRLFKYYGNNTFEKLKENPYAVVEDIDGLGFLTADDLAKKLGIDNESNYRIKAGIKYILNLTSRNGHTYINLEDLINRTVNILHIENKKLVEEIIEEMVYYQDLMKNDNKIYLPIFYNSEKLIAEKLYKIAKTPFFAPSFNIEKTIDEIEKETDFIFSKEQREAIKKSVTKGVLVITGGPGTGKTTIIEGIIALYKRLGLRVTLAAPTGRAAKRMTETTKEEAKTLHRLLEYSVTDDGNMNFGLNEYNPISTDVIIIDEMSMVDLLLFSVTLRAITPGTRLILVGDIYQLPSIGVGNVLKDIIESKKIDTVNLTKIYRQEETSKIIVNAHKINQGIFPEITNRDKDFYFMEEKNTENIQKTIVELCSSRIKKHFGYDTNDIEVITPMKKTKIGVIELNQKLQESINPKNKMKPEISYGSNVFRLNDRVMQIKNNYEKDVFNGDVGTVVDVSYGDGLAVLYNDYLGEKIVYYETNELEEITLSYAISAHKSQGSEFKVVIIPVSKEHYTMLQRNLIYTAITRAKELVILIGEKRALKMAIDNNKVEERLSTLKENIILLFGDSNE